MVKPIMIQEDFVGDFYLGCPNCEEAIIIPFGSNELPNNCVKCGEKFDWSEKHEKGILK